MSTDFSTPSDRASIEAAKTNAAMASSTDLAESSLEGDAVTSGPSKRERFTSCRFLLRIAICLAALILAFGHGFGLAGRKRKQKTVSSSSGTNEEASSPISTPTGSPISAPITSPINSSTSPPTPSPITSPPASVKELLTPLVLTPEEFENHWTVQAQALDSLEQDETIQDYSPERLLQRYVLKVVYISTNRRQTDASDAAYGLGNFGPWREPRHWDDHTRDECFWHGVTCDADAMVTEIDLTDTHLTGELPVELTLMPTSFQRLILNDNPGLGGVVPHFLGDVLALREVSLVGTGYAGSISNSICELNLDSFMVDCDAVQCPANCCTNCS